VSNEDERYQFSLFLFQAGEEVRFIWCGAMVSPGIASYPFHSLRGSSRRHQVTEHRRKYGHSRCPIDGHVVEQDMSVPDTSRVRLSGAMSSPVNDSLSVVLREIFTMASVVSMSSLYRKPVILPKLWG